MDSAQVMERVAPPQRPSPLRPTRIKIAIVVVALALVVAYLVFTGLGTTAVYYRTVPELKAMGPTAAQQQVRVGGFVADGSTQRDSASGELRFTVRDANDTMPVVYRGVVPDIFADGREVVIEGKLGQDGVFQAQTLLTKCPSKMEAQLQDGK